MSILRRRVHADYTVVPNDALHDVRLSWAARGMLAYLLAKPDGWDVRESQLVRSSSAPRQGLDAVRRILAELEETQYLRRGWENGPRGRLQRITELTDTPGVYAERVATQPLLDLPVADLDAEPVAGAPMSELPTSAPMLALPISDDTDIGNSNTIVSTDSKQVLTLEQHPSPAIAGGASAARTKPRRAPTPHQLLYGAICHVCEFDPKIISTNDARNVGELATWLLGRDFNDADVLACGERWYYERFPSRQRSSISRPTVAQLKSWIGSCHKGDREKTAAREATIAANADEEIVIPAGPSPAMLLWLEAKPVVFAQMTPGPFRQWIDPLEPVSLADGVLELRAPNARIAALVADRGMQLLADALAEVRPGVTARLVGA